MTTTESTATDMTTMMEDEMEVTTFAPDTLKYANVVSSSPSTISAFKDSFNSSRVIDQVPSTNLTLNKTVSSEEANTIRISTNDKNPANSNRNDDKMKEDVTNPDGNEKVTEETDSLENEGSTGLHELSDVDVKMVANENKGSKDFNATSTSPSVLSTSKMKNEVMSDKYTEAEQNPSNPTESSGSDDFGKPTEKFSIANDEVEFVEASNDSNAHGLDESNDLKPKPLETVYLTDVKPEVVAPVNSIKESEVSSTNSTSKVNSSETQVSVIPTPISNYQNNSSQSNELNTEIEFGTLKGASSQDLGDTKNHPPTSDIPNRIKETQQYHEGGLNKSHQSALDMLNRIKGTNEYPTETEGMFEVSFDLPAVSPSTERSKLPDVSVSKKYAQSTASEPYSSSETSSHSSPSHFNEETTYQYSTNVPNVSEEDIPDFEFSSMKPHLSSELGENPLNTDLSTTEDMVQSVMNLTSSISSFEMTPQGGLPQSITPSPSTPMTTTMSVQFLTPASAKTSLSEKDIFSREKSTTTTSVASNLGDKTGKPVSAKWPVFATSETTHEPSSKIELTTMKTSITTSPFSTTMKVVTSTKKNENIIPPVPDKLDENNATDEDAYIETDSEQELFSPTPTKIVTTAKPFSSNGTTEITEADLCPSTMLCPVPLHIQLRIESSPAKVCKNLGKLKTSIIKMFRTGTARVQQSEQIKFIDLNSNHCPKEDTGKETDIKFYLADGIGDFEQSINEEFIELYGKMGLQGYEPKVESAHLIMNKGSDKEVSVGSDMDGSKTRVIAAVVIICLAVICLILVILLLMIIRKRQKRFNYGQRCVPVTLDDYSLDNISVYNSVRRKGDARASKRSYGNPAFDDPNGPTHRINFAGLANFASDQNAIDEEFASIPVVAVKPDELPPSAETKNRYANVIPLPETRVHLLNTKTGGCSDYINANYVKGPKREERFYIACQAPLQSTIEDFWRMVWEQQSKVILMLTDFFENGVEKCANYLPPSEVIDCNRVFGDFQVTLKKRENREKYIISSLQLKNLETNSWREVTHLWYTSWPPLGVPNEESSIIAFLIEARVYMKNNTGPNVVHCSPGTGRTGTVIACDLCIRDFELTRMVDVPKCVYMLRRCRAGAVQTKQQYAFIYKVLNLYAAKLTGGGLDSI
ncbi:unnamed protein product [Bemisia tabaci]|uniref:Uncharacterized protein n=2 Tax=Bemisia tabaci TaxID=7038 RepID=A0A9P0ABV7_BEMTA|nr:unnamed protein product [Bemisia tabaci]